MRDSVDLELRLSDVLGTVVVTSVVVVVIGITVFKPAFVVFFSVSDIYGKLINIWFRDTKAPPTHLGLTML